jgi:excisionase family DNA binding protein
MMSDTLKRYLSVKQICDLLPVGKSLVYRMIQSGELPSTRFGGRILVPAEALQALLTLEPPQPHTLPQSPPPRRRTKRRKHDQMDLW